MALSLAACGGSSTPVADAPAVADPVVPVAPVVPVVPAVNTITKALLDFKSGDTLAGTDGDDVLNVEINSNLGNTTTISGIETVNVTSFGATSIDMTKITDVTTLGSANSTGAITVNNIADAAMGLSFSGSGTNSITANYKAGALSGTADNLAITANGATGVVVDADAGFESFSLNSGNASATSAVAASTITTVTMPGVTSATLSGDGALTMSDGTLSNVTTVSASGAGALKLGTMSGIKTFDASAKTGAVSVAATDSDTGLASDAITGVAAGSTIQTGSGADHIDFESGASAGKVNTIKLNAGDDTAEVTVGSGYLSLLAGAGDDTVYTGSTDSNDYIDGGTGDDTVVLTGTNSATLRAVENVTVKTSGTLDATNSTTALAVNAKTGVTNGSTTADVSVTNLASGSTVAINDTSATLVGGADQVTVSFKNTEAASTVDVNTKVTGTAGTDDFTVSKVDALTIDFAKAVALHADGTMEIDNTKSLVITAAADVDLGTGIGASATEVLASVSATGTKKIDLSAIANDAKLATVTVSAGTSAEVGAISNATSLTDVSVTATTTTATLGAVGGGTAATAINAITVSGATTATVGAVAAKAVTSMDVTATKGKLDSDGIVVSNSSAGSLGTVTMTATDGELEVEAIDSDKTMGTITLTSTAGAIDLEASGTDAAISAADTTGITVVLDAKTFISDDGTGVDGAALIENTKGSIGLTVSGAAAANLIVDAGDSSDGTEGTVNLTASNTGGLTVEVINGAVTKDGATSTINLGNAKSTTSNAVTLNGIADTVTVNGGTGTDTVAFKSGVDNKVLSGTFALGDGASDAVDFTQYDAIGTSGYDGLAINLSSATVTFDAGTATEVTLATGKVTGYDDDAASTAKNLDTIGSNFTLSGVEIVTGTAKADYIVASNTGSTIDGGDENDTITLGAGVDTIVLKTGGSDVSISNNLHVLTEIDTVNSLADSDKVDFTGLAAANGDAITVIRDADFDVAVDTDAGTYAIVADGLVTGYKTVTAVEDDDNTNAAAAASATDTLEEVLDLVQVALASVGDTAAFTFGDDSYVMVENGDIDTLIKFADVTIDGLTIASEVATLTIA